MFVNRYTLKINSTTSASTINIPINLEATPVDQSELIEREFVDKELEKAVNQIIDYESVRLTPVDSLNSLINRVVYNLTFNDGTTYGDLGFTQDDLKFRRNKFKRSFLQLDFYDSDNLSTQNFLYSATLFCRVTSEMFNTGNTLMSPNSIPVSFNLDNPIISPDGISEGYYLYDYKDEIPKEIFMRATFNNAKTGISHKFMVVSTPQSIDNLVNNLHTKYILKEMGDGFYYELDDSISNISIINNIATISLYETNVT
jgi:hypothetical protein